MSERLDVPTTGLLAELNSARRIFKPKPKLELLAAKRFSCHAKLAVYGSLAPGKANHHLLKDLRGTWSAGLSTHGDACSTGWAAALGFPAIRYRREGPPVCVDLLSCEQLPHHWSRLDTFEGEEYCRVLVPLFLGDAFVTVANLYEAR